MGDYWLIVACTVYAAAIFTPFFFLTPSTKRRYLPVPFVALAIGLPAIVIEGMGLERYFYVVCLLMLANVRILVTQLRACPQCGAIIGLQRGAREVHHCPVLLQSAGKRPQPSDVVSPAAGAIGLPPDGYEVKTAPNGDLILRYRTTGMYWMAAFFALFVLGWTAGCIVATRSLIGDSEAESYVIIALLWLCNAWVSGYAVWHFFSRWTLTFSNELFAASRSLGPIVRRRNIARNEIRVVRLVQDGGDPDAHPRRRRDTFPSWAIIVSSSQDVAIISRQGWEQAAWLGRFVSDWSGAPFEELGPAGDLKYKRL